MSAAGEGPTIAIRFVADTSEAQTSLDNFTQQAGTDSQEIAGSFNSADSAAAGIGPAVADASAQSNSALQQATNTVGFYGEGWNKAGLGTVRSVRSVVSEIGGLMTAEQGIYDAQQRVNVAQINYTLTIRQYGEGSIQAARALDQLNVAQHSVTLANEQLTLRFVQFGLTVGPELYQTIIKLIAASQAQTVANYLEAASWQAIAVAAGAAAIATGVALALLSGGIIPLLGLGAAAATSSQIKSALGGNTAVSSSLTNNTSYQNSTTNNITQNNSYQTTSPQMGTSLASQSLRSQTRTGG